MGIEQSVSLPAAAAVPRERRYSAVIAAPFGCIGLCAADDALLRVDYLPGNVAHQAPASALAREACKQIERYLQDPRYVFDLPCAARGTPFQLRVWHAIAQIPSGATQTYAELAASIGSHARPVGGACGSNPLPLVVPCHRVVAAGGRLGGFMHSLTEFPLGVKQWLLRHEAR
jgi:methylated-DNA-[protein]-cysteine S-methyltransferase